jgi:hypothetical protein
MADGSIASADAGAGALLESAQTRAALRGCLEGSQKCRRLLYRRYLSYCSACRNELSSSNISHSITDNGRVP